SCLSNTMSSIVGSNYRGELLPSVGGTLKILKNEISATARKVSGGTNMTGQITTPVTPTVCLMANECIASCQPYQKSNAAKLKSSTLENTRRLFWITAGKRSTKRAASTCSSLT